MKEWTAIARATLPGMSPDEIERLLKPLEALEEAFRPLARELTPDVEPAISLQLEKEQQ